MKRLISIVMCLLIIFGCTLPCFATDDNDKVSDYPYIFIPGMVGWGTDFPGYDKFPYWGGGFTIGQYDNLIDILNLAGIRAYAANPGPFNSAWTEPVRSMLLLRAQ